MAVNKIYLRPSADISVGHDFMPSESTTIYSLINETVCDGGSTDIFIINNTAGATVEGTSEFKLSLDGNIPSKPIRVTGFKIFLSGTTSENCDQNSGTYCSIVINGNTSSSVLIRSFLHQIETAIIDDTNIINAINSHIVNNGNNSLPDISIILHSISTIPADTSSKIIVGSITVSQVYVELLYDICIHRKVLGEWKSAVAAYKKINGTWTQIDDELTAMRSNLFSSGHHQELLERKVPTCTETGLTEGYKCSICGKSLAQQEVIAANGHSYIASGGHNVCTVCNHVDGIGFTELVYSGTATALHNGRSTLKATTVGNYALFAGGYVSRVGSNDYYSTIDVYDTALTHSVPTTLNEAKSGLAATTVGNYALFAGGYNDDSLTSSIDAYDTALTHSVPTTLNEAKSGLAATTVGNYALFAGGEDLSGSKFQSVEAYDTSLTRTLVTSLSDKKCSVGATTVGNYALFAGGEVSGSKATEVVEVYDTSLTVINAASLNEHRYALSATTIGNYALFAGGYTGGGVTSSVDAYDIYLTHIDVSSDLSNICQSLAATTIGNYALFGGGKGYSINDYWSTVDVYDMSLIKSTTTELNAGRAQLAATTVGNYALFAGGYANVTDGYYSTVDAYKIQPIS